MLVFTYMIRTQVYLTEDQARDIKLRAKREQKYEAEVIRELIREGLSAKADRPRVSAGEALLRLVRLGEKLKLKAPADLSSRIDHYLYDDVSH